MKALSLRAAMRCEEACTPRCRCRCGGALHGKFRHLADVVRNGTNPEAARAARDGFFEALPTDDPHYAMAPARRKRGKRKQLKFEWWDHDQQ